ncbi:autotransporter outer membrane beta-barrel domain-containing protein, partial [Asaia spathodeae]
LQTSINHQINLVVSDGTLSFWDGARPNAFAVNSNSGNGTVDGGDGVWNAQNSNWTTPSGITNGAAEPGLFAVFEGQAGTVTVSDRDASGNPANVTFSGMQFANNDGGVYKVTGDDLYATTGTTTIRVGDGTTNGSAITANLDTVINDSNVSGGTSLVKSDAGTLIITKDQTYRGDTTISGGTLQLGDGGTGGRIDSSPAIHNNGRLVVNHADGVNLAQPIDGTGAFIQAGTGTTTLGNNNSYTGGTTLTNGGLQGSTTSFGSGDVNVGQNANLIIAQQNDGNFDNPLTGDGQITKQGRGSVVFNRDNTSFNGDVDVVEGELAVNGAMTSATFAARDGGILSGTGALGATTIGSGGVLSPAGSGPIGVMTINRNLTMEPGSTLYMDATSQSTGTSITEQGKTYERLVSDLVNVQGSVNLNGGTVAFNAPTGSILNRNQAYRLIQSTDGISGRFDQLSSNIGNQYLFLSPSLTYSGNAVDLLLNRNGNSFSVVGNARNELAAGLALDKLPETNPVVQVLTGLDKDDARKALNAVSGEIHASIRSALIEDAYLAREAVTDRLDSADCDGADNSGIMRTAATRKGSRKGQCYSDRLVFWTQAYGSLGKNYSNGNAASMNHTNAGFLMGADTPVFETARVGGVFGYSNSTFNVSDGRASSGHSNNLTIGGYAGNHWGKLNVRLGATYTWNMLSTRRTVAFNGYQGSRLGASYLGGTSQAFGEVGYKMKTRTTTVEPFAGVAYVNVHTNSFREKSGPDALAGQDMTTGMTYSTFGIRAAATYQAGRTLLTPRFMVGYRHAFGLTTPTARLNFAGVSDANMDVAGTPIAADVAVINAGFGIKATDRITLGIYYTGQYGVQAIDNGAKANISLAF